jgi:hypothetical protein
MDPQSVQVVQAWATVALVLLTGVTLVFLIRYTRETIKLRETAEKQVEQASMPVLMLVVDVTKSRYLLITNVGTGPAFNTYTSPLTIGETSLTFSHQCTIGAGAEYVAIAAGPDGPLLIGLLQARLALTPHEAYTTRTTYRSVAGKWYRSTQSFEISTETHELIISLDKHEEIPDPTGKAPGA